MKEVMNRFSSGLGHLSQSWIWNRKRSSTKLEKIKWFPFVRGVWILQISIKFKYLWQNHGRGNTEEHEMKGITSFMWKRDLFKKILGVHNQESGRRREFLSDKIKWFLFVRSLLNFTTGIWPYLSAVFEFNS